jgi:uncharacterized protein (DUF983 family)
MKTEIMKPEKKHVLRNILQEKCPNCGQSHVFEKKTRIFELPKMKERCDVCNYYFDREPGYFIGAMYISYGLAVLQGLITFLLVHFLLPSVPALGTVFIILGVIFLFSLKNYKLSRIIYIHIFPY